MNNPSKRNLRLLHSLLRPILEEWGSKEVMNALMLLKSESNLFLEPDNIHPRPGRESKARARRPAVARYVSKESLDPENYELIQKLAESFNDKKFLPRMSDIRNFVEVHGNLSSNFKQRAEAVRPLVEILVDEPLANLRKIYEELHMSGPSELGPLSDAINHIGSHRRMNSSVFDYRDKKIVENPDLMRGNGERINASHQEGPVERADQKSLALDGDGASVLSALPTEEVPISDKNQDLDKVVRREVDRLNQEENCQNDKSEISKK
jgi:hypothetical protein